MRKVFARVVFPGVLCLLCVKNWNLAIAKMTRIGDRVNLTFRAEAFNLFNRVQFGPPNTQASTAANNTFGQVTTQANQPRLMQLAFRLTF